MRSHGVPNFPDPRSDGSVQIPSRTDLRSPAYLAAYRACRSLAPSRGSSSPQLDEQLQRRVLAFAKCMRSHGVPEFPDPDVLNGRTHVRVVAGQIDPNSPIVTAAVAACRSKLAGGGISADNLVQGAAGQGKGR